MDEMRQLIGRRQAEGPTTPLNRPRSFIGESTMSKTPEMVNPAALTRLEESLADVDQSMVRAISHHETMRSDLEQFMLEIKEVSFNGLFKCRELNILFQKVLDLDRTRVDLQNTKRQCELVKSLLADATAEKEIMYEVSARQL
jgi:hypothetical protein